MATDTAHAPAGAAAKHDERDTDCGHEYDGIREFDNRLPNWWLSVLIIAIIFGYGYFFYYHVFDKPGLWETYQAEVAAAAARPAGPVDDKTIMALAAKAPAEIEAEFKKTCSPCHGQKGEGLIGPNLTDNAWLHGGKPSQIYETITKGVVQKGMPSWGPVLGDNKVRLLAAYVAGTLKGKNIPNPAKPPEGTVEP